MHEGLTFERKNELNHILKGFNNIFTINYDWNLEMITGRNVMHLHDQFDRLNPQFIIVSKLNFYQTQVLKLENPVTPENSHMYSNALMGFCGSHKNHIMKIFNSIKSDEYQTKEFTEITGIIYLAGMSPNNDEHIWDIIRKNSKIDEVVYYYHSVEDKKIAENSCYDLDIQCKPISDLW